MFSWWGILIAAGVLVLVLLVLVVVLVLAWKWSRIEQACLARATEAETLRTDRPERARQLCQGVIEQLTRRQKRRRLTPIGLQALAEAYLVMALLDHGDDDADGAWEQIDKLTKLPLEGEAKERRRLRFWLAVPATSADAFRVYFDCCRSEWIPEHPDLHEQAYAALIQCCEVRPDMTDPELVECVKRNQDVRKVFPGEAWSLRAEARAWLRLKNHHGAVKVLDELVAVDPDATEDRIALVRERIAVGETDAARGELDALVKENALDYELLLAVAQQQVALGDTKAASANLNRIVAGAPALRGRAWGLAGIVLLRNNAPGKAIEMLQKALAEDAEDATTWLALAEALSRTGDHAQAVKVLRPTGKKPLPPEQLYALASALFNARQWGEAAQQFERCQQAGFRAPRCALLRVQCLLQLGDPEVRKALMVAETLNPDHPDPAFLRGVLLYQAGAYSKALPSFVRAHTEASKNKDATLTKRTRVNVVACHWKMVGQHTAQRKYPEAVKVYEVLRKNLKAQHPRLPAVTQALAQCHLRIGLERFRQGGARSLAETLQAVRTSVELHADPAVRSFLAALHGREGNWEAAAALYADLLRAAPNQEALQFAWTLATAQAQRPRSEDNQEALQFAWALATLRAGRGEAATETLGRLARGGNSYAVRSALALSAAQVDQGEYRQAVGILMAAMKSPQAAQDPHRGEACRNAVLYALRSGDTSWAQRLAQSLFAGSNAGTSANLLLGCLLVDSGDYDQALPLLEQAVDEARRQARPRELLRQVYRHVASRRCQQKDYAGAQEVLQRALRRVDDPELQQLEKLVTTASRAGIVGDEPDDGVVRLLDELRNGMAQPDVGLVRSAMVVHHRRASSLSKAGHHSSARDHWREAHLIWLKQMAGRGPFWNEYLATYNAGKQYQVQMSPPDLEKTMQRRMAGACIGLAGQAIEQQDFDDAEYYWREARKLAPEPVCKELFKEIVNVAELVAKLNIRTNPQAVVRLYRFLYEKIDASEEYRKELEQLEIVEAVDALKRGDVEAARRVGKRGTAETRSILVNQALEQAVQALKSNDRSRCHRMLDLAGEFDSDWIRLGGRIKKLRDDTLREIVTAFQVHALVMVLMAANPAKADVALFQVVLGYAELNQNVPGGIWPHMVRASIDNVVLAVFQNFIKG